jgi:hypothetical protein
MSWHKYIVTNHALPTSTNPNRWIAHLEGEGISCFSLSSARNALGEYHRRLKDGFGQHFIHDQQVYEDMLSKFEQHVHIVEEAKHAIYAQLAIEI